MQSVDKHEPCGLLFAYLLHIYSILSIQSTDGTFYYND
jgi:hypothetical protein